MQIWGVTSKPLTRQFYFHVELSKLLNTFLKHMFASCFWVMIYFIIWIATSVGNMLMYLTNMLCLLQGWEGFICVLWIILHFSFFVFHSAFPLHLLSLICLKQKLKTSNSRIKLNSMPQNDLGIWKVPVLTSAKRRKNMTPVLWLDNFAYQVHKDYSVCCFQCYFS